MRLPEIVGGAVFTGGSGATTAVCAESTGSLVMPAAVADSVTRIVLPTSSIVSW